MEKWQEFGTPSTNGDFEYARRHQTEVAAQPPVKRACKRWSASAGLVVAVWDGEPQYRSLSIEDPDGMLQGLDREFGVLTFDGTQQYFVLDGQHRPRVSK
jgi:hypothetical protein